MEDAIQELVRLAPRTAHLIRDELSVTQNAMELLMKDQSISSEVREKIASIKGQVHQAAASATQFLKSQRPNTLIRRSLTFERFSLF